MSLITFVQQRMFFITAGLIFIITYLKPNCYAQEFDERKNQYLMGDESQLQVIVHIWGEVNRPGQYLVPDGTNILQLISLAGGPTEFSNLRTVRVTRDFFSTTNDSITDKNSNIEKRVILSNKQLFEIDLKKYLKTKKSKSLLILKPGDVVKIEKNMFAKWQSLMRVLSQMAIIVQAVYFYSRIAE